jgi:fibro-slime domain-containing protein
LNLTRLFVLAIGAAFTTLACTGPEPLGDLRAGGSSGSRGSGTQGPSPAGGINLDPGSGAGSIATGGAGGACQNAVIAVIRDFRGWDSSDTDPGGAATKHPDFEPAVKTAEKGIAAAALGSDQKPIFGTATTVTSADTFSQWYRDTDGVNMRFEIPLPLTPDPLVVGGLAYDNQKFFPIDNQGFGNQGQTHNYSFTTEIHTQFVYKGGEVFKFVGDDDVFVYVNNQLAIDLGGIHNAQTGTVDFDAQATQFGITKGQTYNMDIFHAERHVTESHFRMETKFDCLVPIVIP